MFNNRDKSEKTFNQWIIHKFKPLIYMLDYIFPKNKNKVVFYLHKKQESAVFPYYMHLLKNHNKEYTATLISPEGDDYLCHRTHHILSWKAVYEMLTSKYVVITDCDMFVDFFKSKRHVLMNFWHGMPIKTLGFTETNPLKKRIFKRYKYLGERANFFVMSDIFKQLMISSYRAYYKNVYITGQCRNDIIFNTENDKKLIDLFNFDKYSKVIFYMPTWHEAGAGRNKQVSKNFNNIFYLDDYYEERFIKMLEEKNILFLMKPHPVDEDFYKHNLDYLPKFNNFRIIFDCDLKEHNIDLYETFKFVDIMISDFSSAPLDYLILNKPAIFLTNLAEDYSQNRGMILEDNYEILMPGDKVKTYAELEEKITDALTIDSTKELREKTLPLLHKYSDNKSCERIYEIMRKL